MRHFLRIFGLSLSLALAVSGAYAADPAPAPLPERSLGSANAPIKVDEYVSLTCPHCAEFFDKTLPELEKRYVDTGKVRFVMHDYVMDGPGLKAATLAHCMPADEFYPFVKLLYKNQVTWALNDNPEKLLISYAKLGGLPEEKAKSCLADTKLQEALVAELDDAAAKNIQSTPTFIINDGVETIKGNQPVDDFAKVFDRLLAAKH